MEAMQPLGANRPQETTPDLRLTEDLLASFIDFIDRGETTSKTYVNNLRQFAAWLRFCGISAPTRKDVQRYRDEWLLAEHYAISLTGSGWEYRTDKAGNRITVSCKPTTAAQYLRTVKQFFKWTAANGFYPDIAANLRPPKVDNSIHRKNALKPEEVTDIEHSITAHSEARTAAACQAGKDKAGRLQRSTEQGKRLYAMYMLAVTAGLRTVEISRANVRDLETVSGQAYLYIWGKGHSEPDQRKPIAHEVYEALQDYLQSRTDSPTGASPLFVSTGNRSHGKRIATTTISTMLKKAMQEAGYNSERLTAHSLRHTAGTAVQSLTGNIYATQKYMRHCNPATTEIYLHNETEKQEAQIAEQLVNLYHGNGSHQTAAVSPAVLDYVRQMMNASKGNCPG